MAANSEGIHAGDGTSVLGDLTLGVVEVGGDGDNGIIDGHEARVGGLLHLEEDHRGNLLGD
ncbi:hypothetical protein C8R47DRAFT_1152366 [Mycena vitilis]|nr:hypothetical protein C8R47DRAFT_1152366 [Mycena vitilis]